MGLATCAFHSVNSVILVVYQWIQLLIAFFFSPQQPSKSQPCFGHVAIVGAGLTGISTASQLIAQGFQVTLFEAGSETGGIWANVNRSSGLQINSTMYRFHPFVLWTKWYPHRDEILDNIRVIWKRYGLSKRTRFNTPVTKVERAASSEKLQGKKGHSRWIINGNQSEVFDGLVVTIGTCGKPKMIKLPGQERFKGKIIHSSQLDNTDFKNKKVLIVGGGASGVESLEYAVNKGAENPTILARSDKWFMPRNMVVDAVLSSQPFGRETYFSFIPEALLKWFHYRELSEKMAPTQGFYTGTPVVNDRCLDYIREGKADYQRADVISVTERGIEWNSRKRGQPKGEKGEKRHSEADIIILAAGFERPSFDFLPQDLFPEGYSRPNMYLQVFPVTDWSVLCTNSTFHDAVGTVGNVHIGMYARILALFLLDPDTRPPPRDMRLWVDAISFVKERAPGGQLEFFTYMELVIWMSAFLFFRIDRLKYLFFVYSGYGFWTKDPVTREPRFHLTIAHRTFPEMTHAALLTHAVLQRFRSGQLSRKAHMYVEEGEKRLQ